MSTEICFKVGRMNYKILKVSPSKRRMFDLIVDFITAPIVNPDLSAKIRQIATDAVEKSPKKGNIRAYEYEHFPSKSLLYDYLFAIGEKQIFGTEIDDILKLLEEKWLIHNDYTHKVDMGGLKDQEYVINAGYIQFLHQNNLLYSYLLGFEYICEHFSRSVFKIEVSINGQRSLGTGWIIDYIHESGRTRLVVTNHHVIENADWIKIWDSSDNEIRYHDIEDFSRENHDVAFLKVDYEAETPDFTITESYGILDEVVTLGYPTIPQARDAFQVAHRGEINSLIDDYWGKKLLVVSARTAPGNSGSPVINDQGLVIGMITKELFEKEAFTEKGITPYSACIPSEIIGSLLDKSAIIAKEKEKNSNHTSEGFPASPN